MAWPEDKRKAHPPISGCMEMCHIWGWYFHPRVMVILIAFNIHGNVAHFTKEFTIVIQTRQNPLLLKLQPWSNLRTWHNKIVFVQRLVPVNHNRFDNRKGWCFSDIFNVFIYSHGLYWKKKTRKNTVNMNFDKITLNSMENRYAGIERDLVTIASFFPRCYR